MNMVEAHARHTVLLGSDTLAATLPALVSELGAGQPVALISAGHQDREGPIDALKQAVQGPIVDLQLYARAAGVLAADPGLAGAVRARSRRMRRLQEDYRLRLSHAADAALALLPAASGAGIPAPPDDGHAADAFAALRQLDARHLDYLNAVQGEPLPASDALDAMCAAIDAELAACAMVLVAGGHVAVLRNRIRLFGLERGLRERHLVGWGAGAMITSARIVLFLDRSPRGVRQPEVFDAGIGALDALVVVPAARRRLALDDLPRMALTARRFAPSHCVGLDDDARLRFHGDRLHQANAAFRLADDGQTTPVATS